MKKYVALMLAAAMVLGLVACSSAPAETAAATEAATTAAAATQAATTAAAATQAAAEAPKEQIQVTYYCNVGAYRAILETEIAKFNEGEGKEKGVYINFDGDINNYSNELTALLEAGTHFELYDNTSHDDWFEKGWTVPDLEALGYPELTALVDSYRPYLNDVCYSPYGTVFSLPLELRTMKFAVNTDLFNQFGLELPKTWDDVLKAAQTIGEGAGEGVGGLGWSTWTGMYTRLINQAGIGSWGQYYWDGATETYDFSIYKDAYEKYIVPMYQNQDKKWMVGADDREIDPIRADFSAGKVGMFPAVSYDYAVFTNQFPAECNWTLIEYPSFNSDGSKPGREGYLNQNGCCIDQIAFDAADDAKKQAIVDAYIFLNSDYLNGTIYSQAGMIPYKADLVANTKVVDGVGEQWEKFTVGMADLLPFPTTPDSLLPLEGEKYAACFKNMFHGEYGYDEMAADLTARYNAAYAELKADGELDLSKYQKAVSFKK